MVDGKPVQCVCLSLLQWLLSFLQSRLCCGNDVFHSFIALVSKQGLRSMSEVWLMPIVRGDRQLGFQCG